MTYLQSARAPAGLLFSWLQLPPLPTAGNKKQHAVAGFIDGNLPCLPPHLPLAVSPVGPLGTAPHSGAANPQLPPLGQTTGSARGTGNLQSSLPFGKKVDLLNKVFLAEQIDLCVGLT